MRMSYELPTDVTQTIDTLLATGRYSSVDEVLRDALAALRQREDDVAAIEAGLADVEAGRYRPFSEIDTEFRLRHDIPRTDDV